MQRRSGITLIEVLVAIFIMAIGMMALLTLFPLGALRMAQAIQDDRCGQLAYNGNALAQVKDLRNDPALVNQYLNPAPGLVPPADPNSPSYPVFADPAGNRMAPGWVGGAPGVLIRTPVSYAGSNAEIYKWFASIDDLEFVNNSNVINPATTGREIRYSYACLLQRPRASDPAVVNLSVVVFASRPLSLNNTLTLPEQVYQNLASFDTNRNVVTINHGGVGGAPPPPAVRAGDWIMDATFVPSKVNGVDHGTAHGFFYRVVGVTDINANQVELEVETPFRGFPPGGGSYPGTVIVMEGVVEVFERGPGREP